MYNRGYEFDQAVALRREQPGGPSAFSEGDPARHGEELRDVQTGGMPSDFKPMPGVGKGVYEIRVSVGGAWRVMYVAKFADAVYVLHAFQKKTQQTAKEDIDLARKRFRTLEGRQ